MSVPVGTNRSLSSASTAPAESVLRGRHRWPFRNTDGGAFEAHIHQRLRRGGQRSIASCRLAGTEGPLEGPVSVEGLR